MKPGLAYFPLCLCLLLPFLPSHHPPTYTASFKLLAPHNRENIFNIITLHAPATRCTIHSASLKPRVHTHWQKINKHIPRVSIKIYSLTLSHISSAVGFVCKCLQLNNKNAHTHRSFWWSQQHRGYGSLFKHSLKCYYLRQPKNCGAGHSVEELDIMHVSKRQDTGLSTQLSCSGTHWLHSVGLKEVKEHIISPARQTHRLVTFGLIDRLGEGLKGKNAHCVKVI